MAGITCLVEPQRAMAPCWLYGTAQGPVGFAGGILAWQDRAKCTTAFRGPSSLPQWPSFGNRDGWSSLVMALGATDPWLL